MRSPGPLRRSPWWFVAGIFTWLVGMPNLAQGGSIDPGVGLSLRSALPFLTRRVAQLEAAGTHGAAITYQQRLVAGLSTLGGADHARTLRARNHLARLLVAEGRMEEGYLAFERIEHDLKRVLGDRHVETALARLNQAQVALFWPERTALALSLAESALPVLELALWPDHPQRMQVLLVRAKALSALGRGEAAEKGFVSVLNLAIAQFGSLDPLVAEILSERGWNRILLGMHQNGIQDLERALAMSERAGAASSFKNRIHLLGRLAEGYLRGGRNRQAHDVMEKIVAILELQQGADNGTLAKPLTDLGMVAQKLGWLDRAEVHFKRALTLVQHHQNSDHPQRAFILTNLGDVYRRQGKQDAADRCFTDAEAAAATFFAGDAVGLANWLASMAVILHQDGNLSRATALFSRSLQLLEGALGRDDPAVVGVRESLARLSQGNGGAKPVIDTNPAPTSASLRPGNGQPSVPVRERLHENLEWSLFGDADPGPPPTASSTAPVPIMVMPQPQPKKVPVMERDPPNPTPSPVPVVPNPLVPKSLPEKPTVDSRQEVPQVAPLHTMAAENQRTALEHSGWIVHLGCWPIADQEPRKMVAILQRINIPVYSRTVNSLEGSDQCFFSGPYPKRQLAGAVAKRVGDEIYLMQLGIREYWYR
ncbi:MAG: tetratricopeptide repeat protein [Magnetococcales bacterium]|nr:tetratricopeptide repeat protein [Magnetococcales bacterium]